MPDALVGGSGGSFLQGAKIKWTPWRNDASEECPPYGIIRITGSTKNAQGRVIITGAKPNTTFQRFYAVNGPTKIPANGYGGCSFGFDGPLMVAIDTGTPAYGEGWGAKPDSWKLNKNYPGGGFTVVGGNNTDKGAALFVQQPVNSLIGKLNGTLSQGGSAAVSIWRGAGGSEADETNWDITAYDWLMASGATAIASGKKVKIEWINGVWYATQAECA